MSLPLPESEKMYFTVIEASPGRGTQEFEKYDGAHIACWINTADLDSGRKRAIALVTGEGWFVKSFKEEKIIAGSGYESTNEGLEKFKQALIDGEVCVVYTFPRPPKR